MMLRRLISICFQTSLGQFIFPFLRRGKVNSDAVAYASTSFGSSLINNAFGFYYVKVFVDHYHVSPWWFQAAQVIFLLWNAINDPLFAYIQDKAILSCVKSRRVSILYGAPFFCLAFLTFWFPWQQWSSASWVCGLHLIFSLCFYDALFTFVLLAHCCLITEMSASYEMRLDMKWYGVIATLSACWAVPFLNYISLDLTNMDNFRLGCILLACIGCLAMVYTGLQARTIYDKANDKDCPEAMKIALLHEEDPRGSEAEEQMGSYCSLTMQLMKNINFQAFVWTNFLQIFHSHFLSNFTAMFVDRLAPDLSTSLRSVYYGLLFAGSSLAIIFGKSMISKFGYFNIMRCSCYWKILAPIVIWFLGRQAIMFYLLFVLIDTIQVQACFALYDLALSDIADEDKIKYGRKKPITSMVFGTNALITKPAQSFTAMFSMAVLNVYGYQQVIAAKTTSPSSVVTSTPSDLLDAMFYLNLFLPFTIGCLQLVTWSFYRIRSTHTTAL